MKKITILKKCDWKTCCNFFPNDKRKKFCGQECYKLQIKKLEKSYRKKYKILNLNKKPSTKRWKDISKIWQSDLKICKDNGLSYGYSVAKGLI